MVCGILSVDFKFLTLSNCEFELRHSKNLERKRAIEFAVAIFWSMSSEHVISQDDRFQTPAMPSLFQK